MMRRVKIAYHLSILLAATLAVFSSLAGAANKSANWGPKRSKPVFTGSFQVDLVTITFPDCEQPTADTVEDGLNHIENGAFTIKDYYVDYSQNTVYPVLKTYSAVYVAPQPLGYYCRLDPRTNPAGWNDIAEGSSRASKLRKNALAFVQKNSRRFKSGSITCYVYCNQVDPTKIEPNLRQYYPKPKEEWEDDPIEQYAPIIAWADPLWPCSLPQVLWPSDGRVLVHELGHVLGSPDYYHADERHDGVPGTPCLPWGYSPTGIGCDRIIYHAFVPPETYPTYKVDGTYTLSPRSSRVSRNGKEPQPVLGCFIPSSHPNYMFYLEYVHDETKPVGIPGAEGMLVHVLNVSGISSMLGPPDLCYTYREDDPFMKGNGAAKYFTDGEEFTLDTNPPALIPPLIDGGIRITDINLENGKCKFNLKFSHPQYSKNDLKNALLPRIMLGDVNEVTTTSMRPHCEMMYRGEPLVEEYGFVWDAKPHPDTTKNKFPLYHRDRWDARIIGLSPGSKYYVRAYCKNANGITYSTNETEVTTLTTPNNVPALITDRIIDNGHITRWYWRVDPDQNFNSANTIITLMSLGIYYGVQPGGVAKGPMAIEIKRVHTNPGDMRPEFRMKEYNAYYDAMCSLAEASGLRDRTFGKMNDWIKRFVKTTKIRNAKKKIVRIKTVDDLIAQDAEIKRHLNNSEPVLLLRENDFMPNVTDRRYPLDFAIIDGYGLGDGYHVTFPLGRDRNTVPTGYHSVETLMISVKDALLMYYRP